MSIISEQKRNEIRNFNELNETFFPQLIEFGNRKYGTNYHNKNIKNALTISNRKDYTNKVEKLDNKYPETRMSMLSFNLDDYIEKCYNNFVAALYLRQKRNMLKLKEILEFEQKT